MIIKTNFVVKIYDNFKEANLVDIRDKILGKIERSIDEIVGECRENLENFCKKFREFAEKS